MIPSKINICGVPHTVMLCKDNFTVDSHFGEIEYTQALIKINQDMPEDMQKQALCHEWMLGFNEQSQNEQFVQALSMAINLTFDFKEAKE